MKSIVQEALARNINVVNMQEPKPRYASQNTTVDAELEQLLQK